MNISELRRAMALIREKLNAAIPLSQLEIFFIVAENEGINEKEIAKQITISKPTIKRDIMKLTDLIEGAVLLRAGAGYGVCEVNDDGSVFLTEKGKQLIQDLSTSC